VWDLPVSILCNQHLLAEHRELHAIFVYVTTEKGGSYRKHPETLRWFDRIGALYSRHEQQVEEMDRRGWNHKTPLPLPRPRNKIQSNFVHTVQEQKEILRKKGCLCRV